MSRQKEPHYLAFGGRPPEFKGPGDERFNERTVSSRAAYEAQFVEAPVRGDASPWYLYHPDTPGRIGSLVPNAKMLIVLRDPIDRAYSSYLHTVRDRRESCTFEEALASERQRIDQGWEYIWHLTAVGRYSEQVRRFLSAFPHQVRIDLYEDFQKDEAGYLRSLFEFLGVNPDVRIDTSVRPNATGVPLEGTAGNLVFGRSWLREALKRVTPKPVRHRVGPQVRQRLMTRPEVSTATRSRLIELFRPDIERLQEQIGRDLTAWLTP